MYDLMQWSMSDRRSHRAVVCKAADPVVGWVMKNEGPLRDGLDCGVSTRRSLEKREQGVVLGPAQENGKNKAPAPAY